MQSGFSNKPQPGQRPTPVGGLVDQLKGIGSSFGKSVFEDLIKPIPTEGMGQVFESIRRTAQARKEEIIFDGGEERKKQARLEREKANQAKIIELQKQLVMEQETRQKEVEEISKTIIEVAKAAQIEVPEAATKVPQKPGKYHIFFFLRILADVRKKADEAKDWRKLQETRVSCKPPRGALIWLGDQKKVHEAGATFLLQG
jgi:hypothetical protein